MHEVQRFLELFAPRRFPGATAIVLVASVLFALPVSAWNDGNKQVADDAPVSLDSIGAGELLWKSERGLIPLPVVDVDVRLQVSGILLRGTLSQSFFNSTEDTIEAVYVFPLPERSAVHRMEMRIGDRTVRSVIREKQEAMKIYEQAKTAGRKAALVDQRRPNLFTTSAANINPGETVSIELEYFEELSYEDGEFRLRFPLTFTRRFAPPGHVEPDSERAAAMFRRQVGAPSARIDLRLEAGLPLVTVDSESHEILIAERDGATVVRTRDEAVAADRDFLLRWRIRQDDAVRSAVFVEEHDGERYALVMWVPPAPESEAGAGLPAETLFVVDVSGSMDGPSIAQAREALLAALDRLRPEDRFNILRFNNESAVFAGAFLNAEPDALESARRWVRGLEAGGGTMILPALERSMEMMGRSRSSMMQRIVFLTDGAIANEGEVFEAITERLGRVRLHTIGIGCAPNTYLMRKMASFGHGMNESVASTEQAGKRIDRFFARLARPVMTDLRLRLDGVRIEDPYPARLPDLHAGEPLLLYAKIAGEGSLALVGHTREGWVESYADLSGPERSGIGVATRWARAKVGSLMDRLHEGADPEFVRGEVVDVGLKYHIVTPHTSLVAVEQRPTALDASRSLSVNGVLPQGGTYGPLRTLLGLVLAAVGFVLWSLARWIRP